MDIFARKHIVAGLLVLLVAVNLITLGALWIGVVRKPAAAPPPRGEEPPDGNRPDNVRRYLEREMDLTPEQSAAFEKLRLRHAADIQAIQNEIHDLKKAEMENLVASELDPVQGDDLAAKIGAKEAEKEKLLFGHLRELMALGRPEQQERLRSIIGELIRMMGPPGQSQADNRPPDQKPPKRPGEKPPRKKAPDRPGEQSSPDRS